MKTGKSVRALPDDARIATGSLWAIRGLFTVLGIIPLLALVAVVFAPSGATVGVALGATVVWVVLYQKSVQVVATRVDQ